MTNAPLELVKLEQKALAALAAPPPMPFDPHNYLVILLYIQHFFRLTHPQMQALRTRLEKTFAAQPQVFAKKAPPPVTLNGVAITYGLLIAFGGYEQSLRASGDRVVKVAREYDPYKDRDPEVQKQMHKQAQANRRGRRW